MSNRNYQRILDQFKNPAIKFAYIDLFCGAGGTSTGVNRTKHAVVVACVNHDENAIASHAANHPNALHFVEDIRTINLSPIIELVRLIRELRPDVKIVLWGSLECTHFSKAKGGGERDGDSRTLALHLFRYQKALKPDLIQIENVVEFMAWGPLKPKILKTEEGEYEYCSFERKKVFIPKLGEDGLYILNRHGNVCGKNVEMNVFAGVPDSMKNGKDWQRWRSSLDKYGKYKNDWRELNAADFGAYTSRNRLFGVFVNKCESIVWPKATHAKKPGKDDLFGPALKKWKPVKECLDFSKEGQSIFNRKKPLVEATLERIYAGLVKFVANGDDSFIQKFFSGKPMGKVTSIDEPSGTITTSANQAAVFITKYNSTNKEGKVSAGISIDEPCHTIAVQQRLAKTTAKFITNYYSNGGELTSLEGPSGTIRTRDGMSLIFLDQQYGNSIPGSIDEPAATLTTNPKLAAYFIERGENWILTNSFDKSGTSLEDPAPTILATGMTKYLVTTNFGGIIRSMDEPAPTVTASRRHHYLINPQFASKGGSVDDPSFTLIARMDKMPPYLATAETGEVVIIIYDNDSPAMKKIKIFMAHYGIVDIKMRMLLIPELLRIQGFGDSYVLRGTQTEQKKYIGNAVVPEVVEAWVNAMAEKLETIQPFNKAA